MRILIADDEPGIRITLRDDLEDAGFQVAAVGRGDEAWDELQKHPYGMLITDIVMPGLDGLQLLEKAKAKFPGMFIVMITGNSSDARNRRAVELGVNYYIEKPFNNEQLVLLAHEAAQKAELTRRVEQQTSYQGMVGGSPAMARVFETIETIAQSEFDVLIQGQNGTGKERVARMIHDRSPRGGKPFVTAHCAMYAESLLEDELFGHEAGAYTGATGSREGRFERADTGTIFLDDIDDMPLTTQVKLLRVLQEKEVERLGGRTVIPVNVRVIAATKADLRRKVREGTFREDLFHRINVIPVELPALSERHGDIPLLVSHFIKQHGGGREYRLDDDCLAALEAYHWPGNVRELENAVKRAIALSGSSRVLCKEAFLRDAATSSMLPPGVTPGEDLRPLKDVLDAAEYNHIAAIMAHVKNSKQDAAEILGISRKNLWEKLRKHGIEE